VEISDYHADWRKNNANEERFAMAAVAQSFSLPAVLHEQSSRYNR
jgi:hypothetical protein